MHGLGLGLRFGSLGGGEGGQANNLPAGFYAPMTSDLTLDAGVGTYDFSRDTAAPEATITDFEGLVKKTKAEEARFPGVRRVENLCPHFLESDWTLPTSVGDITVTLNQLDVFGNTTAVEIDFANVTNSTKSGSISTLPGAINARSIGSIYVKYSGDGGGTPSSSDWNAAYLDIETLVDSQPNINLLDRDLSDWTRISQIPVDHSLIADNGQILFAVQKTNSVVEGTWSFCCPQWENVTGQTVDDAPSEYVSVGVGTEAELQTNNDFATNDTSSTGTVGEWTWPAGTWQITGGRAEQVSGAAANLSGISVPAFRLYQIEYELGADGSYVAPTAVYFDDGTVDIHGATLGKTEGKHSHTVRGVNEIFAGVGYTTGLIVSGQVSGFDFWVDNVSVKEIDHGSNVDGVKYFDYHNTLEVVDNVVVGTGGRGSELVANGTFDSDTEWTHTLASISAGELHFDAGSLQASSSYNSFEVVAGNTYEVVYTCTDWTTGSGFLWATESLAQTGQTKAAVGTYRDVFTSTVSESIGLHCPAFFSGTNASFDNFSVKQIDVPNSYAQGSTFGRRVENLYPDSDELTITVGTDRGLVTDPEGGTTARKLEQNSGIIAVQVLGITTAGKIAINSIWLRSDDTTSVGLYQGDDATPSTTSVTISSTWKRYTSDEATVTEAGMGGFLCLGLSGTDSVEYWHPQMEHITSGDTPGEYVSKGVDVYPYSGTGIDGVAEYGTTNPNVVASNVVTATAATYPVTPGDGVLIEGTRTNSQINSEDFTIAAWAVAGTGPAIKTTGQDSPGGGAVAVKVDFTTATNDRLYYNSASYLNALNGADVAVSIWAKGASGGEAFAFRLTDSGAAGNQQSSDITVTNEWARYDAVLDFSTGTGNLGFFTLINDSGGSADTIYFAFPQVEAGSFPSSYIPTEGIAIVRDEDIPNYSEDNIQSTGTVVFEFNLTQEMIDSAETFALFFPNTSGGANNRIGILYRLGTTLRIQTSGTTGIIANLFEIALSTAGRHRVAFGWDNDLIGDNTTNAAALDGTSEVRREEDGSGNTPDVSLMDLFPIGYRNTSTPTVFAFTTIKDVKIYNKLLDDTKMAELSKVESD